MTKPYKSITQTYETINDNIYNLEKANAIQYYTIILLLRYSSWDWASRGRGAKATGEDLEDFKKLKRYQAIKDRQLKCQNNLIKAIFFTELSILLKIV